MCRCACCSSRCDAQIAFAFSIPIALRARPRRLLHLLPAWRLADPPCQREVHRIFFAPFGAARLVERIELHDPRRQPRALKGVDVEAKILAAEPGNTGFLAGCQVVVAGSPPLPQHITAETGDASADDRARRSQADHPVDRRHQTIDDHRKLARAPQLAGLVRHAGKLIYVVADGAQLVR